MDARPTAVRRLPVAPAQAIWSDSLVVTFAFHCNLACSFCMVEDVLAKPYPGVDLERFRALVEARDPALAGMRRIILSGGEVTTTRRLPEYVAIARSLPGVEHVRIQTNAVRLADPTYTNLLVEAGVDEFFVSIHGADSATCDGITGEAGSFEAIVEGMRNVRRAGGTLITNTVLVQANHRSAAAIADLVCGLGTASMELWSYWPRVHERATEFAVPVAEARPSVIAAMTQALRRGVPPVVRWFPRCLLPAELQPYHDDGQPKMVIEDRFWDREPGYGCLWSGVCDEHGSKRCSGLSHAYVNLFGWEEELLKPTRESPARTTEWPSNEHPLLRTLIHDEGPRRTQTALAARWLLERSLAFGGVVEGFTLATLSRTRFGDRIKLGFVRDGARVELVVGRRDGRLRVTAIEPRDAALAALVTDLDARLSTAPDALP